MCSCLTHLKRKGSESDMGSVTIGSSYSQYDQYINNASSKYGVPTTLIKAVIKQESGGNAHASSGKASGLMQLTPDTARGLGVTNVWDPAQNIDGGTKYLAQQLKSFNGSVPLALAAYNAGPNAVKKYGGVPPYKETQNYVSSIMSMVGSGNVDIGGLNTDGSSSGNPLDIGATIVNGFQKIFQMILTDTTKFLIYLILFFVFVFFGYKALAGSPPVAGTIRAGKQAGSAAKKTVKTIIKVMPK